MLLAMPLELQKQHENLSKREIYDDLQELFQEGTRVEWYYMSQALFNYKMAKGNQVKPHVPKMIRHIERLKNLGSKLCYCLLFQILLEISDKLTFELRITEEDMKSKTKTPKQALLIGKSNKRQASGIDNFKAKQAKKSEQPKLKKGQQKSNYDDKDVR